MKKNSLRSYKVQCRTKSELKTTNQIPKSPLRMSSLGVVHYTIQPRSPSCDNHQHVQHVRHLQRTDVTFDDIGNITNGNRNY